MRSRVLLIVAVLLTSSLAVGANNASAQGIHFGAGPVHVDVGNPHGGWYGGGYGGYYGGNYGHYGRHHSVYSRGYWGGGHSYHDTSHYDYHPAEVVRHRNHYHYMPGHYDYHQTGHWHHDHH